MPFFSSHHSSQCDHGNPCNRCSAVGVTCKYSSIKRESSSIGLAENDDTSPPSSPDFEADLAPSTRSVKNFNLLEEIKAMRDKLKTMRQIVVQEQLESLTTPPPQIVSLEPDHYLLSVLPKLSIPSEGILQELEKYDPSHLMRFCPLNWAISFSDDGYVVVDTRITNATDLAAEIARLCTLQTPPGKNPLRNKTMRGGIYAAQAMRDVGYNETSKGIWKSSTTNRLESDENIEEELRAFNELAMPSKKDPVRQHWSSIYSRAVSKVPSTEGFPVFDLTWKIPQGLDLPAARTTFLLMAYHICYFYFQGTSLSSDSANSSYHLLQYARCAWSAQHIAIHHSSPDEQDVLATLIEDPIGLSECYYMCARNCLEELFDVPDVHTVESLMILSNVQAHWDLKQSSRYLSLAIYMAIECGLHRVSETGEVCQQDGEEEVESGNFFFGQTRDRRIWWLLYYYDSMRAILGDSPPIIAQQLRISVPTLLMPLDPENLTARVVYFMCEMMQLTRITRDFVITVARMKADQSQELCLETAVVGLREWHDAVPELLRLDSKVPVSSRTLPVLLQMRYLLDLHYYFFCLVIYAPFFLAPREGEAPPPVPARLRFYATQICARASEIVTGHILAVLALEKNPSYPQHLFSIDMILYSALTASARVAEHQLLHASKPHEQLDARKSLERCVEALEKNHRVFSPSGPQLASKIDALLGSRSEEGIEDHMGS